MTDTQAIPDDFDYAPEDQQQDPIVVDQTEDDVLPPDQELPPVEYPGFPPGLKEAVRGVESGGNNYAVSNKGARGPFQIMPAMWDAYDGGSNPFDPDEGERIAGAIYHDELARFKGNQDLATAAYNAGSPRVIEAIKDAGYTLDQAAQVSFDKIEPYLPYETRDYVQKVNAAKRSGTTDPVATSPADEDSAGTTEDLQKALNPVFSDPEFQTLSTNDKLRELGKLYSSHKYWSAEALDKFKELSTIIWDSAPPNESPNYGGLFGDAPELSGDSKADAGALNQWKKNALDQFEQSGENPIFYGNQLDNYFTEAGKEKALQAAYRNRGTFGSAYNYAVDGVQSLAQGVFGSASSIAAFPVRAAGFEDSADKIQSLGNTFGEPNRDFLFEVNDNGSLKVDQYGRPITKLQGQVGNALGQMGFIIMTGGFGEAATGSKTLASIAVGGANALQTMNQAYIDARENGGSQTQALTASVFSLPSAAVDTVGDMFVFHGGPTWIKGLSTYNKAKALGGQFAKQALAGGITEGAQQYLQDLGTSFAINYDITDWNKVHEAAIVGGFAQGVGGTAVSTYEGYRNPKPPPPGPAGPPAIIGNTLPAREPDEILPPEEPRLGYTSPGQLGGPPERRGLPAPQLQLPAPPGQASQPQQAIKQTATPDPEEQLRIAQEFQRFQESTDMERVITVKSPSDIDVDLLNTFGYRAELQADGRVRVIKDTTHLPAEMTGSDPEQTKGRIQTLTVELANSPRPEEHQDYVNRRDEVKQELADISDQAKSQFDTYDQLDKRKPELEREIAELEQLWKDNRKEKDAPLRVEIDRDLKAKRQELQTINAFLRDATEAKRAFQLKKELRYLDDAINQLTRNNYPNDLKAKEAELKSLMVTQDLQNKAPTGLKINTPNGFRWIVNLQGKWRVLDEQGNPLSQGHTSFPEALDTARDVIDTENEGFVPANPTSEPQPAPRQRPLRFRQRQESPVSFEEEAPVAPEEPPTDEGSAQKEKPKAQLLGVKITRPEAKTAQTGTTQASNPNVSARMGAEGSGTSTQTSETQDEPAQEEPPVDQAAKQSWIPGATWYQPDNGNYVQEKAHNRSSKKQIRPSELIKKANKILKNIGKFGLPKAYYQLRQGGKGIIPSALGYIHYGQRYVWNKAFNDIPTAVHEMAHAINEALIPDWNKYSKIVPDLIDTARKFYSKKASQLPTNTQVKEGFSMFLEHYFQRLPVNKGILDWYKNTFAKDFPEMHKELEAFKAFADEYYSMDALTAHAAFASADGQEKKPILDRSFFDRYTDTGAVLEDIEKASNTSGLKDLYDFAKNRISAVFPTFMSDQAINNAGKRVGGSFEDAIALANGMLDQLKSYLVANRNIQLNKRNLNTGLAVEDSLRIKAEIEGRPILFKNGQSVPSDYIVLQTHPNGDVTARAPQAKYSGVVKAAQAIYDWQEAVNDYAAELSPQFAQLISELRNYNLKTYGAAHGYYVPFGRDVSEKLTPQGKATTGGSSPLKKIGETQREIKELLLQIPKNAKKVLEFAQRRQIEDTLFDLADSDVSGIGKYIRPVPKSVLEGRDVDLESAVKQLNSKLKKAGIPVIDDKSPEFQKLKGQFLSGLVPEAKAPRAADGFVVVSRVRNGEVKYYEVDPRTYKLLNPEVHAITQNKWFKLLVAGPTRLVKLGATSLNPRYLVKNTLFRDMFTAGRRTDASPLALLKEVGSAFAHEALSSVTLGKYESPLFALARRLGATKSFYFNAAKDLDAQIRNSTGMKVINLAEKGFGQLERILSTGERATRLAAGNLYLKSIGKTATDTLTPQEQINFANTVARSTTDFNVSGSTSSTINQVIPFFSPRIAEVTQLKRDLREHRGKTIAYAAAFLGVGIAQALRHKDDRWWQELDPENKVTNYLDTVKDADGNEHVIKVPLETLGSLFNGMGVAIGEQLLRDDTLKPSVKEHLVAYLKNLSPVPISGDPLDDLSQLLGPLGREAWQIKTNHDIFFNKPIVPKSLEEAPAEQQFTKYTTEFAKELGKTIGWSPAKIDHLIYSQFPAGGQAIRKLEDLTGINPQPDEASLNPIAALIARRGYAESVLDRSNRKFYEAEATARANKDTESTKEKSVRIKLTNLRQDLSDIDVLLSVDLDSQDRKDLYEKKKQLLDAGLKLANGESTQIPNVQVNNKAEKVRKERKKAKQKESEG